MAKSKGYKFNRVFIPDIWSDEDFLPAIELELLRQILDGAYILKSKVTLIDFLSSICEESSFVSFVKRGKWIGEKYISLWPTEDFVTTKSSQILASLSNRMKKTTLFEELRRISLELMNIVNSMGLVGNNRPQNLRARLREIRDNIVKLANQAPQIQAKHLLRLKDYNNEISIVFQNDIESEDNILFTGDFGYKRNWEYLERNKNPEMHEKYSVIKAPHHGTEPYYHSFCNRLKDSGCLLISNGENTSNWKVDAKYIVESAAGHYKIICSHKEKCYARGRCGCVCWGNMIYPESYTDIDCLDK